MAEEIDRVDLFTQLEQFDLVLAPTKLKDSSILKWTHSIINNKKASLYKEIKNNFITEPYVYRIHNKRNRSLILRLRAGCLDLEIETRLVLVCTENYILRTSKFIRHLIYERKHIL